MKIEDLEKIPESEGEISNSDLESEIEGHLASRSRIISDEFGELAKVVPSELLPDGTGDQLRGALEVIQQTVIEKGIAALKPADTELALSCAIDAMTSGDTESYEDFMDVVAGKAPLIT